MLCREKRGKRQKKKVNLIEKARVEMGRDISKREGRNIRVIIVFKQRPKISEK